MYYIVKYNQKKVNVLEKHDYARVYCISWSKNESHIHFFSYGMCFHESECSKHILAFISSLYIALNIRTQMSQPPIALGLAMYNAQGVFFLRGRQYSILVYWQEKYVSSSYN